MSVRSGCGGLNLVTGKHLTRDFFDDWHRHRVSSLGQQGSIIDPPHGSTSECLRDTLQQQ